MGSLFTLAIRLIKKSFGTWSGPLMAVKVCLQAPKELRTQVEINLSHGEQPPLLKTHLCVLGGTGHEGE